VLFGPVWVGNLVLLVVGSDEVLEDGSGLENVQLLAISGGGVAVCDGGDTSIRVNLKEPWLLLLVVLEGNDFQFIWETEFLQGDANLVACELSTS
jgi:hypothetical protein